jgi:hypothetical protein
MDQVLDFLKAFNIQTIVSLFAIVWYFSRDIKSSIEKVDSDLKMMNTRISRLEGTVYGTKMYEPLEIKAEREGEKK